MFARPALRAVQPLKTSTRLYASDSTPKTSSKAYIFLAAGAALAVGGYKLMSSSQSARRASPQSALPAFVGADQGFVALRLADVETVNDNTSRFRFELPQPNMVSGLHIASAILTRFQDPKADKPTMRPYTPISDEAQEGHLDLLVKKYPGGAMSSHIHSMKPGQTLEFKGPLPKYPWSENKHDHIALIAGGTGITPMYQLCRAIFSNPNDKTKVTLVFGNVSEKDILLKRELAQLENTYPQRFRAFYVLDKAPNGWQGTTGHISKPLLKTVLPEPKSDNIKVFVCGPPGLMKAISGDKVSPTNQGELSGALKELGYASEQVYKF